MDARTLWWLVLQTLITNFACDNYHITNPFVLQHYNLTATEGSCVEIKCKDTKTTVNTDGTYWFWIKNPTYNETGKRFEGTVIYSTNEMKRPVSSAFKNRVNFTGSPTRTSTSSESLCSILICNLNKTDSGNYSFRILGEKKDTWITKPETTLNVTENPCPITFEQPAAVKENQPITLTCSTLHTCPSKPMIKAPLPSLQPTNLDTNTKTGTISFTASWENDGNVFTCEATGNKDKYLIREISIAVEYAPRETFAKISSELIREGDTVTLSCSSKGRPNPRLTWFRNGQKQFSEAKWKINSIQASDNGSYYCEAKNDLGTQTSSVTIDVKYAPIVEVRISKEPRVGLTDIKQGDKVTLTCDVKKSYPFPSHFTWVKDGKFARESPTYVISSVKPEDSGNYTCTAWNTVGNGTAEAYLPVQYRPRNTRITINGRQNTRVKVNSYLTFTCDTEANPVPSYSWYKQIDSSWWTYMSGQKSIILRVKRTDEACYRCNATNIIDTGDISDPMCIKVLFPPTRVALSMDTEVMEGQAITINCTAESFPPSHFTISFPSDTRSSSDKKDSQSVYAPNIFRHIFTASSTDTGLYTCEASNSEGKNRSNEWKLVVKYTPKVKVEPEFGLTVKEKMPFKLDCRARSYPAVSSVIWIRMTDGRNESIESLDESFSVKSASPSDSGLYSCTAKNEIGVGRSQQVEVQVEYAPKNTTILKGEEQQRDGTRFVMLSCSTHCFPQVTQYFWYRKAYDKRGDVKVSKSQNLTVYSNETGEYYCIAQNEMGRKSSEPIRVFDDRFLKGVKYFLLICLILLICLLIVFLYRHRRNNLNQRGATQPSSGFMGWRNGVRARNLINETALAEPSRSRDDLLPQQLCRPNAQRCQPRPDSTPAPNVSSVYATVILPCGTVAPSVPKPKPKHEGHMENDSLNYASLHFGNTQRKPEEDAVYAKVSKAKESNKLEILQDYENVSTVHVAKLPDLSDSDSDSDSDSETSDDEVEINYSQVNFKPNPGHRRYSSDSTSSEEETQYSHVKV